MSRLARPPAAMDGAQEEAEVEQPRRSWWSDDIDHPRHGPLPGLLVLSVPVLVLRLVAVVLLAVAPRPYGGDVRTAGRRVLAVLGMLLGAVVGTLLVRGPGAAVALGVAVALVAVVLVAVAAASRRTAAWQEPSATG